jgi:hypothetical protein
LFRALSIFTTRRSPHNPVSGLSNDGLPRRAPAPRAPVGKSLFCGLHLHERKSTHHHARFPSSPLVCLSLIFELLSRLGLRPWDSPLQVCLRASSFAPARAHPLPLAFSFSAFPHRPFSRRQLLQDRPEALLPLTALFLDLQHAPSTITLVPLSLVFAPFTPRPTTEAAARNTRTMLQHPTLPKATHFSQTKTSSPETHLIRASPVSQV